MSTKDGDTPITCNVCGRTFPKRKMTGIGSSARMTWLCLDCVIPNVDRVMGQTFGKAIDDAKKSAQEAADGNA